MLRGELAHLAGAQHQDRASRQRVEDLAGQLDGRVADGYGRLADGGLVADPLAHLEALAEQLVEDAARSAVAEGVVVGLLHLPEDLRLAEHHRVERGDHSEQVADHRVTLRDVQVRRECRALEVVVLAEEVDYRIDAVLPAGCDRVDLGAIAGGEDDCLGDLV
jgi:hypothetical protein